MNASNEIKVKLNSGSTWDIVDSSATATTVSVGADESTFIISNTYEPWIGYSIMELSLDGYFEVILDAPSNPYKIEVDAYGDCWVLTHNGELFV